MNIIKLSYYVFLWFYRRLFVYNIIVIFIFLVIYFKFNNFKYLVMFDILIFKYFKLFVYIIDLGYLINVN